MIELCSFFPIEMVQKKKKKNCATNEYKDPNEALESI